MTNVSPTEQQLLNEIDLLKNKISELKLQASQQFNNNDRLKHLAGFPESNPNPVIEIDSSKTITYFNEASVNTLKNLKVNKDLSQYFPNDIDNIISQLSLGKKISFNRIVNLENSIFEEKITLFPDLQVIRFYIIDISERQKAQHELIKTKQLLEKVTETTPAIISVFDINLGENIYQNRSLLHTLGYNKDEIKSLSEYKTKDSLFLIHPDDLTELEKFYESIPGMKDDKNYELQFRIKDKHGEWQWIRRLYSIFSRDSSGYPVQIVSIFENINERKKAEEIILKNEKLLREAHINASKTAERFRIALANSPIIVFEQDLALKYTWIINPALGLSAEYMFGKTDYDLLSKKEADLITSIKRKVINENKGTREVVWLNMGGEQKCYDFTVEPLIIDSKEPAGVICAAIDITERLNIETAVKENEEKFRTIFENANDVIVYVDKYAKVLEINDKVEKILGYKREELIGKNFLTMKLFSFDILKLMTKGFKNALLNNETSDDPSGKIYNNLRLQVKRKDNSTAVIETNSTLIRKNNKFAGFLSIIRDVTAQEESLIALKVSEETNNEIINKITESVIMHYTDGSIITLNDTAASRIGVNKEQLIGKNVYDFFEAKVSSYRKQNVNEVIKSKKPSHFTDYRSGKYYDTKVYPLFDGHQKVNRVIIFSKDITEAKSAELLIKESEEKYRNLVELSPDAILVHHNNEIVFANEASVKLFKASCLADLIGMEILDLVHPSMRTHVKARISKVKVGERAEPLEEKLLRLDGSVLDAEVSAIPFNYKGHPSVQVIARDITERKKVLNFIRESEIKYKTLFESSNDAIVLLKGGLFADCNSKALEMFGSDRNDFIGKSLNHFSPETQPGGKNSAEQLNHILNNGLNGDLQVFEWQYKKTDNSTFDGEVNLMNVEIGGIEYKQMIIRDITERKIAEKTLNDTRQLLEKITDASPSIITVFDVNREMNIYKNRSLLETLGYSAEYINKLAEKGNILNPSNLIHPQDTEIVENHFNEIPNLEDGKSYTIEYRIKDAAEKWNWIKKQFTVFHRDNIGKPDQILSIFENTTDRKESEIALQLSEEFNRAINENSPLAISVHSRTGKLLSCNSAWSKFWNISEEELALELENDPKSLVHSFIHKHLGSYLKKTEKIYHEAGTLFIPELKVTDKKRKLNKWTSNYFYVIKDRDKRIDRVVIITEDITERKHAESALNENRRKLVTLMSNLPGMAYRCKYDEEWTMEFVNEGCFALTGYKDFEIINNHVISYGQIIHPEDREMVRTEVEKAFAEKRAFELTYRIITHRGTIKWVWEKGQGVLNKEGELIAIEGFISDISENKTAQEQARKLFKGVEESNASIVITDLKGDIEYVNPTFTKITGYTFEEAIGNNPRILKSGHTQDDEYKSMWETLTSGNDWRGKFHNKKKNGELFWESASISPIKDEYGEITHYIAVKEDITSQKMNDEKILNSLKEKEVMLREIHHRVKNNLQIVSSLLKLQAGHMKDQQSRDAFIISQNRVKSMALIHQQLYRSTNLSKIDFGDYIKQLTNYLQQAYITNNQKVLINVEAESIFLEVDTAIPCGLIINELISNSFKHAFINQKHPKINVKLTKQDDRKYMLEISDNGIGLPENFDIRNTASLGMQLVVTLTEQLDGTIESYNNNNGAVFKINFISSHYEKRL
jgi:PAS domain S-box-containing protein